jgi:ABC-type transport system substrate-binding protein
MVFTQRGFAWDDERARVDSGSSDVSFVPRDRAAEVKAAYGVAKGRFFARRDLLVRWVYFNPGSSVFKDNPKLREAVNYALDRPALVRAFGGKLAGVVTDQLYPAEMAGFRDQKVYPVEGPNFAKARALANGRTRGGVVSMWAPGTPERQRAAEILVANLKQIGLDVRFALPYSCPPRPYCGPDIGIGGWYPDYPDPYQVIVAPFTDGVYGFLHNTPLKSQIASASRLRGEARIRAFSALENAVLQSQAPAAPFMVANAFALVSPRIGCFTYNEVYGVDYAALCLK